MTNFQKIKKEQVCMASDNRVPHSVKIQWTELGVTTGIFFALGAIAVLLSFSAKKGHRSTVIVTACGTTLCFWLMWFCTYAIQINPLIKPQITVNPP
ncbi:ATP synthase subunit H [Giardia duodenalis]|uniref:ATP synthase subunit H n=1 Tax=Giardia intestinalis TaxID=5741 RepID=V6TJM8_GIAIN|nr:ATP synthase subunit H [Giardia intestinalis]